MNQIKPPSLPIDNTAKDAEEFRIDPIKVITDPIVVGAAAGLVGYFIGYRVGLNVGKNLGSLSVKVALADQVLGLM